MPLLLARQEAARDAAAEALAALCSYHQDGKLAQLEALVAALQRSPDAAGQVRPGGAVAAAARAAEPLRRWLSPFLTSCACCHTHRQVFELLDALLDGMECGGEEAGQHLELLRPPLLAQLRARQPGAGSLASLSLLATLCERRPDAAEALLEQGAAAAAAQHLLHGAEPLVACGCGSALCCGCGHMNGSMRCRGSVAHQFKLPLTLLPRYLLQAGRWCRMPRRARCGACSRAGAAAWPRRARHFWAACLCSWRCRWRS